MGLRKKNEKHNIKRRERHWKMQGIFFQGKPLKWKVWLAVLELQDNRCAICGVYSFWIPLTADHNHQTGEFRGALCFRCNRYAVGLYEKYGKYKTEVHSNRIKSYLESPPAKLYIQGKH